MTQDEIIRMARESGVYLTKIGYEFDTDDLCRFAALVAAHERGKQAEQEPVYAFRRRGLNDFCTCTKERYEELVDKPNLFEVTTFYTAPVSAEAIRARGPNVTPG